MKSPSLMYGRVEKAQWGEFGDENRPKSDDRFLMKLQVEFVENSFDSFEAGEGNSSRDSKALFEALTKSCSLRRDPLLPYLMYHYAAFLNADKRVFYSNYLPQNIPPDPHRENAAKRRIHSNAFLCVCHVKNCLKRKSN